MSDWALPINPGMQQVNQPSAKRRESPFLDSWASHTAFWGTRHGTTEALDRYFGLYSPGFSSQLSNEFAEMGIDDFMGKNTGPLNYNRVLKLDNGHLQWKDATWKNYKEQVKANTYEFRQTIRSRPIGQFFSDISPGQYARETLWESNITPFKDLLSGTTQNLFTNLGYTAGVGLVGASIIKTGVQHYRAWKQRENDSISSQWRTAYETGKAVCQKAIQSFGSWEAAGMGMAIGQALIPVGAFPIGGILIGALFATSAYKAIGKLFPSLTNLDLSKR